MDTKPFYIENKKATQSTKNIVSKILFAKMLAVLYRSMRHTQCLVQGQSDQPMYEKRRR